MSNTEATLVFDDESGLMDLRGESLDLISLGPLVLVAIILLYAAIFPFAIEPTIWLVLLPLLATGSLRLVRRFGNTVNGILLLIGLLLSVVAAVLTDPSGPYMFALPTLVLLAGITLGTAGLFGTASLMTIVTELLARHLSGAEPAPALHLDLLLVWSTAVLAWLAERPTRTALAWSWRSYLLAVERSDELRRRQAELGRLAKSLGEACERLEHLNGELERARQSADVARRLKAEFAAAISHELRTPLNLIVGFADMMMNAPVAYSGVELPPPYRRDLEVIHRNASHITRLIDDVLDLSQIEAHRMPLDRSYASLPGIVEDAVGAVSPFFERLSLSVTNAVNSDLAPVFVDANRIRQILINLLYNAARFTDRGGVTLRATCNDNDVVISVADTGAGISPEDLPHVFEEFRQVGPVGQRRGGSGLGLAVCKHFAEMHGGAMWAQSTLGQGSTFYLSLPRCDNVLTAPLSFTGVHPPPPRTIVIYGMETEMTKLFQRYLDGYHVEPVASIAELRHVMKVQPIHALVLTDPSDLASWPTADAHEQSLRNLPVITCSLRTPQVIADELGVAEYLTKPLSRVKLQDALRRACKRVRDVVVVDDDPEMARLLCGMIHMVSRRCRVRLASNGVEALAIVRQDRPDVLLLDLLMNRGDGYGVIQVLRQDALLCDIPVIVVTGKGVKEEVLRSSALGIGRSEGLTVGEIMRCLRGSLDGLLQDVPQDKPPTPAVGFVG